MSQRSIIRSIALRFMLRGTEKGAFSPMTLFAWLAIGIGVGAMSSLLAVMYGFEGQLKTGVLNVYPHVIVRSKLASTPIRDYEPWTKRLREVKNVKRVMPYVESEMILQSRRRTLGGVIWGISLEDMRKLKGKLDGLLPNPKAKIPEVLVGSELAHRLHVVPGSELKIISPIQRTGAMGLVPEEQTFVVAGLYASGHYEFDEQYLFLFLEDAQDLLKWGNAISGWHVWANHLSQADQVQKEIENTISPDWQAQSWTVFNSALFSSLKLEQYSMFTILDIAILIAVMNIVITLMMHVTHKRKNIGILRALGASKRQVRRIFVWQGVWMGAVGLSIGALLTVLFVIYVRYFSTFQLPDIYYDRSIPIELRPVSLAVTYLSAALMIYLATLYPATRAASLDPIEAIRE